MSDYLPINSMYYSARAQETIYSKLAQQDPTLIRIAAIPTGAVTIALNALTLLAMTIECIATAIFHLIKGQKDKAALCMYSICQFSKDIVMNIINPFRMLFEPIKVADDAGKEYKKLADAYQARKLAAVGAPLGMAAVEPALKEMVGADLVTDEAQVEGR